MTLQEKLNAWLDFQNEDWFFITPPDDSYPAWQSVDDGDCLISICESDAIAIIEHAALEWLESQRVYIGFNIYYVDCRKAQQL